MLGDDLEAVDGSEVGAWIEPALGGGVGAVTNQVPKRFEAYARIFHPATDAEGNRVTWAEMARRLGKIAHPEMQWHQIVGTADTFGIEGSNWTGNIPSLGEMGIEDLDNLCAVLGEHTADPEHCYSDSARSTSTRSRPNRASGHGWSCRLAGTISFSPGHCGRRADRRQRIVDADSELVHLDWSRGSGEPAELDVTDSFWREAPNLIWPGDRSCSWSARLTSIPLWSAAAKTWWRPWSLLPGSRSTRSSPTKLTAFSDKLNPVP